MNSELTLAEIGRLYPVLAPQVERVLGRHLLVPPGVLEEACQRAWGQLIAHRREVDRERALSWLATTARRESVRILREAEECVPLVEELALCAASTPDPARVVELRDRLARLRTLPERQQRAVWLRGLGYGCEEIALRTGDTPRTVERQLIKARRRLREADPGAAA